jgi:glutathione peroxidase
LPDKFRREANMNIYGTNTRTLSGEATSLSRFAGQVTLIVNVASECGYTPQYAGLERLQQRFKARGFSVVGFPSNDFGGQEPGTPEQIQTFCSTRYNVSFPLFEKVSTKAGPEQSPVYAALSEASGALPKWNFSKYLVGRDGKVIEFYPSSVDPEDPKLVSAIESALAASA